MAAVIAGVALLVRLRRRRATESGARCSRPRCSGRGSSRGRTSSPSRSTPGSAARSSSSSSTCRIALGYSALEVRRGAHAGDGAHAAPVVAHGCAVPTHGPRLPMTVGPLDRRRRAPAPRPDRSRRQVPRPRCSPRRSCSGSGSPSPWRRSPPPCSAPSTSTTSGSASGTNNAVARLAGLLAVAVIPSLAGVELTGGEGSLPGYTTAMRISAALVRRRLAHRGADHRTRQDGHAGDPSDHATVPGPRVDVVEPPVASAE